MGDDIKLSIFRGTSVEDPDQHFFLCEAVWNIKQVQNDDTKKAQLATTIMDKAITWFMKFSTSTQQPKTIQEIKNELKKEFKKPKLESQCIIELKEIKQMPHESIWDFDPRFKTLLGQINFEFLVQQHQEWFIPALLPHIRFPLMQQKVTSQSEALEIAMRLEASKMSDSTLGMDQLQNQLVNITLELQSLKKGKEVCKEVWCTKCRIEGHLKEQCPVFMQYLASGAPNPLPQTGRLWCEICRQAGHRPQDCHMLQKYTKTPRNLYYTFYSSIGHDDNHYRAIDMMMERTQDVYVIQSEQQNHPARGAQHNLGRGGYGGPGGYECRVGYRGRGGGQGTFGQG